MAGYLLDTNIVSETRKTQPFAGVIRLIESAGASELYLSVLTLGELRKGIAARRRSDPAAADRLGAWVDGIETMFADRVLPVDAKVAQLWGELSAGRSLPVIETLIVATAIIHGPALVTRNTADFTATGATLIDPWRPE